MTDREMGRGGSSGLTDADILRGRVLVHLEELEAQRDSFDRVAGRLGQAGFVSAWARSGTAEQMDDKGALERAYEQIVNDCQGMLDVIETAAFKAGLVPDPVPISTQTVSPSAREDWWGQAEALAVDTSGADHSQVPGRWRLAFYGLFDHAVATDLISWCDTRNLFQHGYAHRNETRGLFVWQTMHALRATLPQVITAIIRFRDRVAPPQT